MRDGCLQTHRCKTHGQSMNLPQVYFNIGIFCITLFHWYWPTFRASSSPTSREAATFWSTDIGTAKQNNHGKNCLHMYAVSVPSIWVSASVLFLLHDIMHYNEIVSYSSLRIPIPVLSSPTSHRISLYSWVPNCLHPPPPPARSTA